jgi:hypothetical protein
MKPVERAGHINLWIVLKQQVDGKFYLDTSVSTEFGMGMFKTELEAQHQQTMALLRNERVQVFHLEYPL